MPLANNKPTATFILLSLISSAFNYFVYPTIARILPTGQYIDFTLTLSIFTQLSVFFSSIVAITIGLAKRYEPSEVKLRIAYLQKKLLQIFLIMTLGLLIFSPIILPIINIQPWFAIPLVMMMIFSIPLSTISGYMNGNNRIVKLGYITTITASSQYLLGTIVAFSTHSGIATMYAIACAQLISITTIYRIFRNEKLPGILDSLKSRARDNSSRLVRYTIFVSFALTALSIAQIADFFLAKSLTDINLKLYTDIYTISRVVFFVGTILIWPFLGQITHDKHKTNIRIFYQFAMSITLVSALAIATMYLLGDRVLNLLFNTNYSLEVVQNLAFASIYFKYIMLIIFAAVLYLVVHQSMDGVALSLVTAIPIFIYIASVNKSADLLQLLGGLSVLSTCIALLFGAYLYRRIARL